MNAHRKVLGCLVSAFATAAVLAAADTGSISGFHCVEDGVAVGGQPTVEQVPTLAAKGYRTVINLRLASEFDAEPVAFAARRAGMSYVSVPISAKEPTDEAVEEFLRVTDDPGIYPIFIHCGSGNRAAALWMIRRVLREGWHIGIAISEASAAGLQSEVMRDFALDYIQRHAMAQAALR
ncbi:MAG: protein tyrosine phosphatase family protein [Thermoanaerobaculia bacterium]